VSGVSAHAGRESGQLIEKEITLIHSRNYRMWERFSTAIYSVGQTLANVSYEDKESVISYISVVRSRISEIKPEKFSRF